ncbi:MAG: hypothetical protein ACYCS1_07945 [Gammaproteobacteria bacterium]
MHIDGARFPLDFIDARLSELRRPEYRKLYLLLVCAAARFMAEELAPARGVHAGSKIDTRHEKTISRPAMP